MKVGELIRISKPINVCGEMIQPGTITRVAGVFSGGILPVCAVAKHGKFGSGHAYCGERFEPLANVKDNWADRVKVGDVLMALVNEPCGAQGIKAGHLVVVGSVFNGGISENTRGYCWDIDRLREWFAPVDGWQHPTVKDIKVGDKLRVRAGFDRSSNPTPPDLKAGDVATVCEVCANDYWQVKVDNPEWWSFTDQFLWNVELVKEESKPWHERIAVGMWLKVVGNAVNCGVPSRNLPIGSKIQVVEADKGDLFRTTGADGNRADGSGGMWHWIGKTAKDVLVECEPPGTPDDGMEGISPEFAWLRTIKPGDKLEVLDTEYHHKVDPGTVVEFIGILDLKAERRSTIRDGRRSFGVPAGGGGIQVMTKLPDGSTIAGRYALHFKPVQRVERRELTHREALRSLIQSRLMGAIQ